MAWPSQVRRMTCALPHIVATFDDETDPDCCLPKLLNSIGAFEGQEPPPRIAELWMKSGAEFHVCRSHPTCFTEPGQVAISDIRQQAVALGGGFKNTTVKSGGAHAAGEKRGASSNMSSSCGGVGWDLLGIGRVGLCQPASGSR
ncbi:hypothetical protein AK812_SmicGene27610 [Symbiodinium microadriaticum]|uniref:Uncharacterized protein n=1 Tax=Symbiodinium microadriaticum TaxID=2951 RepID=A0A1Q9D6H7_SYMMI|nr:hypothetical protein AK812_SmicGene27610 [Symbiodinium microadriaticum]